MAVEPNALSFEGRSLTLGGEPFLMLSGAVHYWRYPPSLWRQVLQACSEGGLNTVETYVFWGLHEPEKGTYDFDDRYDLARFLQIAGEEGFNVFLRVGPYICAEVNYGGHPAWLREVSGIEFRTYNEPYIKEVQAWLSELMARVEPLLRKNGGPVFLMQIENEYGIVSYRYEDEGVRYQQAMAEAALALNTGTPWTMCHPPEGVTLPEAILPTINDWFAHTHLRSFWENHPDKPALWTELWTGWYDTWDTIGGDLSPEILAYEVARFVAEGGRGVNYYMYGAGLNFGREGMYLSCPNYGFGAPIDVQGRLTLKGKHLAGLHAFLSSCLPSLGGEPVRALLGADCVSFSYGDLTFICNDDEEEAWEDDFDGVAFVAAARSVVALQGGAVVYDSHHVEASVIRDEYLPLGRALLPNSMAWEPFPSERDDFAASVEPIEQLSLTQDRSDYCWYSAVVNGTGKARVLEISGVADLVNVFVDGVWMITLPASLAEDRRDSEEFIVSTPLSLPHGEHQLDLLVCSMGLIKGDWMIDANMAAERKGIWGSVTFGGKQVTPWEITPGLKGEAEWWQDGLPVGGFCDQAPCWAEFEFPKPAGSALYLVVEGATKGVLWLNGLDLGRFWDVWPRQVNDFVPEGFRGPVGKGPAQRFYAMPAEWLTDTNRLVMFVESMSALPTIRIFEHEYEVAAL